MGEKVEANLTEEKNETVKEDLNNKAVKDKVVEEETNSESKKSKTKNKNNKKTKQKETSIDVVKTPFSIMGIPVVKLFAFFVIFSVLGFFLETLFALVTKGVIESRKSFLYGPFCAIYGVGATVMVVGLQKFKKNNYTLFLGGFLIGSVVEYIISWVGEMVFDIKWWDYSRMPFNINGRVCMWFSIFWGVLGIYLMNSVYPKVDKLLNKISFKTLKKVTTVIVVFMFIDWIVSSFAVKVFFARVVYEHNIPVQESSTYIEDYEKIYNNTMIKNISDTLFSDEIMIKSFPNLKLTGENGEIILVSSILNDIQPYYVKVFTPREIPENSKLQELLGLE